jgi:preprotein translocase subunit SecD
VERGYWLRAAAILALILGSVYVLLPSFVADRTIALDVTSARPQKEKTLEVWLTAADGAPDEADVAVLQDRLRGAGLAFERVELSGERVVITTRQGTRKEPVAALASAKGDVGIYGTSASAKALPKDVAAIAAAVAGEPVVAGATPTGASVLGGTRNADGSLAVKLGGALDGAGPWLVSVDGVLVGALTSDGPNAGTVRFGATDDADRATHAGMVAAPSLPEVLARYAPPAADAKAAPDAAAPKVEQTALQGLLPQTKIALGLDLQGGIDLTLQVDQDDAVLAKVARDRTTLRDQLVKDGKDWEISRERARPALRVAGDELGVVKTWFSQYSKEYTYVESIPELGKSWHLFVLREDIETTLRAQAVEQVLETLRKRVDSTGVKEPAIVQMPGGRINIQLPGAQDAQQAIDAIGTQAMLEFRLVDDEAPMASVSQLVSAARSALPEEQFLDDGLVNEWLHEQGKLPEDRLILWEYEEDPKDPNTLVRGAPIQLKEPVVLTGGDVNNAVTSWDQNQQRTVQLEFKPQGASAFCDITTNNVKKRFAIILDGQVRSAPQINEPICGGSAQISIGQTSVNADKEANTLALVLRTGSLTAPVDVGEMRVIGPSLGKDAIQSGLYGSLVGGAITFLFMLAWYQVAGGVAIFALLMNVLLVFACLALFGATLTLPGIAGIALTIGMAVDANIIVFERIREELALGVSARKAVDTGFDKGVVAVLDGNLTTAVAGIVLYSYGTGPIKGFAVTLLIGILTTIITGVYVTRTLLEMITRNSNVRLRM